MLWAVLFVSTQNNKHIWREPTGMHQGAQTDRACIAYNYYSESMNFFKPRVSEKRAHDGICGLEFPVVNYTAACLYKLLGFRDFWYRALMFLIATLGVLYGAKLMYRQHTGLAISLPLLFIWMASPVLLFYSISYLPDMAAMSFCILGIYFLQKSYHQHLKPQSAFYFFVFFVCLSGLIKITYLLYPVAFIAAVFLKSKIKPEKKTPFTKYLIGLIIALIPVGLWYFYANRLTAYTGNMHFLQHSNPPQNISEFFKNISYTFQTWGFQLYPPVLLYGLLFLFTLVAFLSLRKQTLWALFYLFSMAGVFAVLVLFSRQFLYHDYYLILFYPLFFTGFFLTSIFLKGISKKFPKTALVFPIVLLSGMVAVFFHANKNTIGRFEKGNYLNQVVFDGVENYTLYQKEINKVIPPKAMVLSAFDPQPNATLYLLKHPGVRIFNDFDTTLVNDIIQKIPCDYFVINDLKLWNQKYAPALKVKLKPLWSKENIHIFRRE